MRLAKGRREERFLDPRGGEGLVATFCTVLYASSLGYTPLKRGGGVPPAVVRKKRGGALCVLETCVKRAPPENAGPWSFLFFFWRGRGWAGRVQCGAWRDINPFLWGVGKSGEGFFEDVIEREEGKYVLLACRTLVFLESAGG